MNHAEQIAQQIATMKTFTFGIELETIGRNREQAAAIVASAIPGSRIVYEGGHYNCYAVVLPDGRKWTCVTDASLTGSYGAAAEVVTPICTYADIDMIQAVCRALARGGAKTDSSCGIHIHIGAGSFDSAALTRLAKLVYQQENLIFKALDVQTGRMGTYCRPVEESFIARLASQRPANRDAFARAWYNADPSLASHQHYHSSRYHGLNMHSVLFRGTVEFRYFEGTLHAGKVRAYLQFCLALAAKAQLSKSAVARKRAFNASTAKYDFRVFLLRLALIGDEFKTARLHLSSKLEGSAAWKNGRPTVASTTPATTTEEQVA